MYIEINLLPQAFRPKKRLIKLDYKFALVLVIVLGASGIGYYYNTFKQELAQLNNQIDATRKEEVMLRDAVALNDSVAVLRAEVAKRVGVIKDLTSDSDVRFVMLEHINGVIPDNLWLLNIAETAEGNIVSFNIEGMAYAKEGISSFLAGLKTFDKFSQVALESIRPAPLEIKDAYNFVVKVDLIPSRPVTEEAPAAAQRRPRARR